jgi:membrane-associated phospholipid phosphatase
VPVFDQPYDLERFIETSTVTEGFDADGVKYNPEEMEDLLKKITGSDVKYNYTIYFPYYLARYSGPQGIKYERVWSPRFKPFFPRKSSYGTLYHIIDKFPDFPYLVMAFFYVNANAAQTRQIFHIFAATFLFAALAVAVGITLKGVFRTQRRTPFYATQDYGIKFFRYGFPSLHSLVSFGAITFTYFIDPGGLFLSLLCVPVALFFFYSRIRIGAHSRKDVMGGAIIGLFVGLLSGYYILNGSILSPTLDIVLSVIMVASLIVSIIARIKYMYPEIT